MPSLTSKLESSEKLKIVLTALDEKKAIDPEVIDMIGRTLIADYFVVASGTSSVHMRALADGVVESMEEQAQQRARREGLADAAWILLDYGDVVVHIFSEEARGKYDLDSLWKSMEERREAEAKAGQDGAQPNADPA